MEEWKSVLTELAKRLTPALAFAALTLILISLLGDQIPAQFQAIPYILIVGCQFAHVNVPGNFGNDVPLDFTQNAPPDFGQDVPPWDLQKLLLQISLLVFSF